MDRNKEGTEAMINKAAGMAPNGDLIISGSGSAGGGHFDEVRISGSGKITGNVSARLFKVSGSGHVRGNVSAERIKISGSCAVEGAVEGGELSVSGSFKADDTIRASEIEISGSLKTREALKAVRLQVKGDIQAGKDLEAEEVKVTGGLSVGGLLNANRVQVDMYGTSYAKEMGGEEITVRKAAVLSIFTDLLHSIAGLFRGRDLRPNMMNADLIEGTLVNVEYTRARLIRGNRVVIGPHCEVERVEYTESLTVDPSASVGSSTET